MRWPFAVQKGFTLDLHDTSPSLSTKFAFSLFRQFGTEKEPKNVFFSPSSVLLCLCLLHEGASGETKEAMDKVLEVAGLEPEALRSAIGALQAALRIKGPGLQLVAANSIWYNPEWVPRSKYLARVREDYDAEVIALDALGDEMVARINSWVSAKTHDKIESIVGTLDPLTSLLAINASYFKDLWEKPFIRDLTREESFHDSEGRELRVPLMSQYGSYPYYEESKFQAVRLGYKTSRLAMYVFLPAKRSSLTEFRQNLNSATWDKWTRRLKVIEGHIRIPRFRLTYESKLNSALAKLGMEIAFDPRRARFDAIHPPPPHIWIDRVIHRAFVEVNEEGTEAAAVTAVHMVALSMRPIKPPRPFEMIVDRPFFFAICDDETKSILFMGSIEEPHR